MGNGRGSFRTTYFCDLGVGAFAPSARELQPPVLQDGAMVLQGAPVLVFTPATLVVRVCFQAEAAAVSHGPTFVQVDCWERKAQAC